MSSCSSNIKQACSYTLTEEVVANIDACKETMDTFRSKVEVNTKYLHET